MILTKVRKNTRLKIDVVKPFLIKAMTWASIITLSIFSFLNNQIFCNVIVSGDVKSVLITLLLYLILKH